MKAIVIDRFGGPEELHPVEVPDPVPGRGQVLVRVAAAGVNPWDAKLRSGRGASPQTPMPVRFGLEAAGLVVAVGDGVTDVRAGERVVGFADTGAYAELALLTTYAVLPDGLDAVDAATLPVASEAAARALRVVHPEAGETLLVHGASGAVGELAVQLAAAAGVHVIGTASAGAQERVAALGARPTTYGPGWPARVLTLAPDGVDAVLDTSGAGVLEESVALVGGPSRVVTLADGAAAALGVTFTSESERDASALADVVARRARGELTTTVGRVLQFERAAEAHALLEDGRAGGKVVLVP